MFKKAEKSELRTWCLGSLVLVVLCVVIAIAMIVDMITIEFKVGSLIITCLAALFGFLFTKYMIAAYKAYKTYDERKKVQDEEEAVKQAEAKKALEEKIRLEKEEMEAIRIKEEERARNNALELEQLKKEQLEKENEKKH